MRECLLHRESKFKYFNNIKNILYVNIKTYYFCYGRVVVVIKGKVNE
jgi:hypothetical protein